MSQTFYNCKKITGNIYIDSADIENAQSCFYNTTNNKDVYIPLKTKEAITETLYCWKVNDNDDVFYLKEDMSGHSGSVNEIYDAQGNRIYTYDYIYIYGYYYNYNYDYNESYIESGSYDESYIESYLDSYIEDSYINTESSYDNSSEESYENSSYLESYIDDSYIDTESSYDYSYDYSYESWDESESEPYGDIEGEAIRTDDWSEHYIHYVPSENIVKVIPAGSNTQTYDAFTNAGYSTTTRQHGVLLKDIDDA